MGRSSAVPVLLAGFGVLTSCGDVSAPENRAPMVTALQIVTLPERSSEHAIVATDPDGDPLTFSLEGETSLGQLELLEGPTGRLSFVAGTTLGREELGLIVEDGRGGRTESTITVRVVEDRPIADPQTVQLMEDQSITIQLVGLDPRGTDVEFQIRERPMNGRLEAQMPTTSGRFTFTPSQNYFGDDMFTFEARDPTMSSRRSEPAEVSLVISPVNDAPNTVNQSFRTEEDTPLDDSLSAFDVENDALSFELMREAQNGTVELQANGMFHYEPAADFNGRDTFRFRVSDGQATSEVVTATVTMRAVNDGPVVEPANVTTTADTPVLIQLVVRDVEADSTTSRVSRAPSHGSAEVLDEARGWLLYRPAAGYVGPDELRVRATDDLLVSNEATVQIAVTARSGPVNAPGLPDPDFARVSGGLFPLSPDLASSRGLGAMPSPNGGFFLFGDTVTGLRRRPTILEVTALGQLENSTWARSFVRAKSAVTNDLVTFARDSQGRFIVATQAPTYGDRHPVLVRRLRPDGTTDTSFGFGGETRLSLSADERPMYLGIDDMDGVVVAASSSNSNGGTLHVVHLDPNGSVSASYALDDEITGKAENQVRGLHIEASGRILIANEARTGSFIANMETQLIALEDGAEPVVLERVFLLDHTDAMVVDSNRVVHLVGHTGLANAVLGRIDLSTITSTTMDLEARCATPQSARRFLGVDESGASVVAHQGSGGVVGFCRIDAAGDTDLDFATQASAATQSSFGATDAELRGLSRAPGQGWLVSGSLPRAMASFADWAVVALDEAGEVRDNFGEGGELRFHDGSGNDIVFGFDVEDDGRVVAFGRSEESVLFSQLRRFSVFRITAEGEPDPAFAGGSAVPLPFEHDSGYPSGSVQSDGMGGALALARRDAGGVALTHFDATGALDASFGTNGVLGPLNVDTRFLLRDASNRLLMVSSNGRSLIRFLANGMADSSFGVGGSVMVSTDQSSNLVVQDLAMHSNGRLAVVLSGAAGGGRVLQVLALDANGVVDSSFGGSGIFSETLLGRPEWSYPRLRFDPQGRIVLGVYAELNEEAEHLILRLSPNGSLDPSFGTGGRFRLASAAISTMQLAVDALARVSFTAVTNLGSSVFRLDPSGQIDPSFGVAGESPVLLREPGSISLRVGQLAVGDGVFGLSVASDGLGLLVGGTLDGEAFLAKLLP